MNLLSTYHFVDSWVLWFLLLIPALIGYYLFIRSDQKITIVSSNTGMASGSKNGFFSAVDPIRFALRMLALALFIIALARPQLSVDSETYIEKYHEGIDIVIALDASGSMMAADFKPDRFEASKLVAQDFVAKRKNDRIGLVIFEGEAYTQCPLTSDNKIVTELIGEAKQQVVQEGTAIGMGLATAVNRLRESTVKSKVIILLTDGVNTHGKIHPLAAAEIAKEFGMRVYTIGVGTNGKAKTPVAIHPVTGKYIYDYVDVEIDEKTLKEISAMTGGKYFRATDNDKLKSIYDEINLLEKDKIKSVTFEVDLPEKSMPFLLIGIGCILFELLMGVFFKSLS